MSIVLNDSAEIRFVADAQVVASVNDDRATFNVPQQDGSAAVTYVRVDVRHADGERLFLQPVRFQS